MLIAILNDIFINISNFVVAVIIALLINYQIHTYNACICISLYNT